MPWSPGDRNKKILVAWQTKNRLALNANTERSPMVVKNTSFLRVFCGPDI